MQTIELPIVAVLRYLMNPLIVIGSLVACLNFYGFRLEGKFIALAVLAFVLSLQLVTVVHLNAERSDGWVRHLAGLFGRWFVVLGVLAVIGYSAELSADFPRQVMIAWGLTTPLLLLMFQGACALVLSYDRRTGAASRRAVIVGVNDLSRRLAREIGKDATLGIRCVGFFDDRSAERLGIVTDRLPFPLLGKFKDLTEYVRTQAIHMIVIALPMMAESRILSVLDELRDTTASIYFLPDPVVFDLIQARSTTFRGLPLVAVCESPFWGLNGVIKRVTDIALASLILVTIAPLLLLTAIGVKLSSPGPIIFRQRRYGLDGAEIVVYKFRSMAVCEDGAHVEQAKRNDNRTTRFGAFLRKTSLDELPQFVNVLQGRMSIVGPRPHAVSHNELYRQSIRGYMVRHKVKPGITGWAQVNGYRGETDTLEKMKKRVEYDLDYLRNWSLPLDLQIILRTALLMVRDPSAY